MIPVIRPVFLECQNGNFTENSFTIVWFTYSPLKTKTENDDNILKGKFWLQSLSTGLNNALKTF